MNEENDKLDLDGISNMFDKNPEWMGDVKPHGKLFYGDNHKFLSGRNYRDERYIPDDSVDLIPTDPPFGDVEKYNVFNGNTAQQVVYNDMWRWNYNTAEEYRALREMNTGISTEILHFKQTIGKTKPNQFAYLVYMAFRLVDIHRVLKSTGTMYLQCDSGLGFKIKTLMDGVFGEDNFRDVITWSYTKVGGTTKKFMKSSDMIFRYTKGDESVFNMDEIRGPYSDSTIKSSKIDDGGSYYTRGLGIDKTMNRIEKTYLNPGGRARGDWWNDIPWTLGETERLGYATQKPEAIYERLIKASSNEGDTVLDPFCGGGTTPFVAERFNRNWIGIDASHEMINVTKQRFKKWNQRIRFGPVEGSPLTIEDLDRGFLNMDGLTGSEIYEKRMEFQWWVMDLIGAQPRGKMKLGPDGSFDAEKILGLPNGEPVTVLYEVKSGKKVSVKDVWELEGVVNSNSAMMGVLIVRYPNRPTEGYKRMEELASRMGLYSPPVITTEHQNSILKIPKIQLFGVEELMDARRDYRASPIILPQLEDITFKKKLQEMILTEGRRNKRGTSEIQELECRNVLRNWE